MTRAKYMKGDGVPCPECYGATRVKGTSPAKGHRHAIRRRRACLKCGVRFTTIEMPAGDVDATARKINDRVEFNDRFMALDEASRLAVRQMVTALEQATARQVPKPLIDEARERVVANIQIEQHFSPGAEALVRHAASAGE